MFVRGFPFIPLRESSDKKKLVPLIGASCLAFEVTGGIPVRATYSHEKNLSFKIYPRCCAPPSGETARMELEFVERRITSNIFRNLFLVYRSNSSQEFSLPCDNIKI